MMRHKNNAEDDNDDEDVIKGKLGTHGLSGRKHFSRVDTAADIGVCKAAFQENRPKC